MIFLKNKYIIIKNSKVKLFISLNNLNLTNFIFNKAFYLFKNFHLIFKRFIIYLNYYCLNYYMNNICLIILISALKITKPKTFFKLRIFRKSIYKISLLIVM